ncbi:MAG: hypothetical protein WDN25_26150 [Acetobacteraceae bacterium]
MGEPGPPLPGVAGPRSPSLTSGRAEGAAQHAGDLGRAAVLQAIDEQLRVGAAVAAVEALDPVAHALQVGRLHRGDEDRVHPLDRHDLDHVGDRAARGREHVVHIGGDLARAAVAQRQQREGQAAQVVDVERGDVVDGGVHVARGAGDQQQVARGVGPQRGARRQHGFQHAFEVGGSDVLRRHHARDEADRAAERRLARGAGDRHREVGAVAQHERDAVELQRTGHHVDHRRARDRMAGLQGDGCPARRDR